VLSTYINPNKDQNHQVDCQIRIKGQLDAQWGDWFEGLTITSETDGVTILSGPLIDQAALYGVLKKIRDLGMPLISISPVTSEQASTPGCKPPDIK
jgi:hypothetical protein